MKVFVTGASGFVGSAVVKELLNTGHQVLGLARSDESAMQLKQAGAAVHWGDLTQPESLIDAVTMADAVIHLGFVHDFSRFKDMCELDGKLIETIGEALVGTQKPFIITSALGVIAKNGIITEYDQAITSPTPRIATERAAEKVAAKGVRVSVIRLSPVVHDVEDRGGFIPILIRIAREKGLSAYINEGANLWPAVHRQDAALLYRLVLEKTADAGIRYHAVAENGIPFKLIAEAIAKQMDIPAVSIPLEKAALHFGWIAHFAQFSMPASGEITQQVLAWKPKHPALMEDLEGDTYFPLL